MKNKILEGQKNAKMYDLQSKLKTYFITISKVWLIFQALSDQTFLFNFKICLAL